MKLILRYDGMLEVAGDVAADAEAVLGEVQSHAVQRLALLELLKTHLQTPSLRSLC